MQAGTFERLEAGYIPCPTSGCWLWVGTIQKNGYGQLSVNGKKMYAHRFSYESYVGEIPAGMDLDHKCGCRSCVNPEHLRPATRSQNMMNTGKQRRNTSGFKGVSWDKSRSKWAAKIGINKKYVNLGRFNSAEEASEAYCRAAKIFHNSFSNNGGK